MDKFLLPSRRIKITSGLDRYGFSNILANKCGLAFIPRSFANWIHGWIWYENPNAEDLMTSDLPKDLTTIVRNDIELIALKNWGFSDVRLGGLPFSYVPQQHVHRNSNRLLVFPLHSDETFLVDSNVNDYLDYLETLKRDFESIHLSIYSADIGGRMHRAALDRGFYVLPGARPDDANSMLRMRAILDSFEYVTTNNMGSHFLYALYAGCKISISGPVCQLEKTRLSMLASKYGYRDDYAERVYWYSSEEYLREKFKRYFTENPRQGVSDMDYAIDEIGARNIMTSPFIKDALGWTIGGQLRGYSTGFIRRFKRLI